MKFPVPIVVVAALVAAPFNFAAAGATSQPRLVLRCPDRAPRASDIDFAIARAGITASAGERRAMLERARSVCAAQLSRVTLVEPRERRDYVATVAGH